MEAPWPIVLTQEGHLEEKPSTRRCQDMEKNTGRERHRHKGYGCPRNRKTPKGTTETWEQAKVGKGGGKRTRETAEYAGTQRGVQIQVAEDGGWRVAGGGYGRRTGGRRSTPGEEVGIR